MTLDKLKIGQKAKIISVGGEESLRCHLLDMGLIPKTSVSVRRIARMGDAIEISLRGYELTLRLEDAKKIEVSVY